MLTVNYRLEQAKGIEYRSENGRCTFVSNVILAVQVKDDSVACNIRVGGKMNE